jgi:peroxiredoxin
MAAMVVGCTSPMSSGPAPEIQGVDADGAAFKLSDYRGKVVLLDFWFAACPYCKQMHGEEQALLTKYKDQPFVILGVNTDQDLGTLRDARDQQHVTWRSWWDADQTAARAYGVQGYPSLFLIDAGGTIRKRYDGLTKVDVVEKEVDKLLAEVR